MKKNIETLSLLRDFSSTEFQLGRGIVNYIEIHCKTCSVKMYKIRMMNILNGLVHENFICYRCGVIKNDDQKRSNGSEKI